MGLGNETPGMEKGQKVSLSGALSCCCVAVPRRTACGASVCRQVSPHMLLFWRPDISKYRAYLVSKAKPGTCDRLTFDTCDRQSVGAPRPTPPLSDVACWPDSVLFCCTHIHAHAHHTHSQTHTHTHAHHTHRCQG